MIEIDGSEGEGGGQILRSSLALSLITGIPVKFTRIRAGRAKPGLMRQHLTAVEAARTVGNARVDGARQGSTELSFYPQGIRAGTFRFAVGTAGSATLVLQTVLPALLRADQASDLVLEGGTHNPAAPPFDFLERVFAPALAEIGGQLKLSLERPGFFPKGGGRFRARIEPGPLRVATLVERGAIEERRLVARVVGIPDHVGQRELDTARQRLGWEKRETLLETLNPAWGPGNFAFTEVRFGRFREIVSGFGERGVRAEAVGERIAEETAAFLAHGAPIGEHLADQLILPMALAGGGTFLTGPLSMHTKTQLQLVPRFLPIAFEVSSQESGAVRVEIKRT